MAIGIGQIGAASGFASGSTIYRYYRDKGDVLTAIVRRFHEWVAYESASALQDTLHDHEAIRDLADGYIRVARRATDLLAVVVTESLHLPEATGPELARMSDDSHQEWARWLAAANPLSDAPTRTILVNAVRTVINDLTRTRVLTADPRFEPALRTCVMSILLSRSHE